MDGQGLLGLARQAADEHAKSAQRLARFVDGLADTPDAASRTEYATLLRQEQGARDQRTQALAQIGLDVPSMGDVR